MSMKVLIISDAWHPQVNGVVRTYEYIIKEMDKKGITSKVIGPADFPYSVPMPFYPEILLVMMPDKRLTAMINAFGPDKIHIATEGPLGWAARRYCKKYKTPFTTSYHTQFPDYVAKRFAWLIPPLYKAVHRLCIRLVRHFHAPSKAVMIASESLHQQLKSWGFQSPLVHLTRGVDLSTFYIEPCEEFSSLPKPVALYVGRIAIEKNLNAFLDMPWNGSKVLVGDGPVLNDLKSRYPNAHFLGKKIGKDLAACYNAADVFVFPSKTDTFGIVLIEALACGLPVAAYPVTGPKDIIVKPELGALHENLSIAAQIAIKQKNPEFCAQYVKENFTWEKAGDQFTENL